MHSKSNNKEIMTNDEVNKVIKELFDALKKGYQNNLESIKDNEFFYNVQLLYYKCHKRSPNRGVLSIHSSDWIKHQKATINPINKEDNKCPEHALTAVLNYGKIKNDLQRTTKLKLFINKYNLEGINFPLEKDDWKKIEKNIITIALKVFYAGKEKIYPACVSKHKS